MWRRVRDKDLSRALLGELLPTARNARPLSVRRSRVSDSKPRTFFQATLDPPDVSGTEKEKGKTNKISVEEYIARALARELIKHPKYQDQVRN